MSRDLVILGTGPHARKAYYCALSTGWQVVAFVDEAPGAVSPIPSVQISSLEAFARPPAAASIFIAIGNAGTRHRLMARVQATGWVVASITHRSAWIAPDVRISEGVLVGAAAVVETASTLERGVIVDIGALVDHDCQVGAFAHIRAGQVLGPRTSIPPAIGRLGQRVR